MNAFWWALVAAGIWGFVPLLEKLGLGRVEPLAGIFYRCVGVMIGFVMLACCMVKPAQIRSVDLRSAFFLIAGGFLASVVAQIAFYNALKLGDVSRVVPLSGSYPFLTFILGVLILGESVTLVKILGVVLIVAGMWVLKIG